MLPGQISGSTRHFVNMVSIRTLPDDKATSTNSSTGSVPTEVLHPKDEDYNLDLPPYPPGFFRFPVFPPQRGDLVFNVRNDEPVVDGETDEQRQQREQRNADRAQRWIKSLSVSCVTIEFVVCAPSTDKLLPWVYPKVDCRLAFVDSGAPGRGCAYNLPSEQDGHRSSFRGRA